jgi:hypothetical protein
MRRFRAEGQKSHKPRGPRGLTRLVQFVSSSKPASCRLAWLKSYLLARLERLELERRFDRACDVRFVREGERRVGERAVLLRRVERVVLRDAVRRFVPVLRRAVDLRAVDLRAVDLRVVLRDAVLRAVVLRAVALRAVVLRPVVLRPDVLRPEDAAVLPARSRRFVCARLRLFFAGLS